MKLDITGYIKELILLNECIILPGLGGFISRYRPASIDSDRKIFSPPSKEIEFRDDLKKDNGLLINHIAKKNKISNLRAAKIVENFVNEIVEKLNNGEKAELKGIGFFRKDIVSSKINFSTYGNENYLVDSYGLPDLELSDLKKTGGTDDLDFQIPPIKTIRRKRTGFWIAASILILILLLIFIIPFTESGQLQDLGFNYLFGGKPDTTDGEKQEKIIFGQRRLTEKDSVAKEIGDVIDMATKKEVALAYSEPEESGEEVQQEAVDQVQDFRTEETLNQADKYYIVAGSFRKLQNAQKLKQRLANDGFDPRILQTSNGYFRVTINSFQNRDMAIRELQRIRQDLNRSVWILTI
jgi:nucleoid DNA-binding protein